MSPGSTPLHQEVLTRIAQQIANYLDQNPIGKVYVEVDVNLGAAVGRQFVYRPDVVYLSRERAAMSMNRIEDSPDVVVEVLSPDSRNYDTRTKKGRLRAVRCG